jgi:hypothetical protein
MRLRRHGRRFKKLRLTPVANVDADLIISVVAFALVALIGANTWLLLSLKDRISKSDKRVEALGQRITKLIEWTETQAGNTRKRGKQYAEKAASRS